MNSCTKMIKLPVFDEYGQKKGVENIAVEQGVDDTYRIVHSPGFVEGLAAGDTIKISTANSYGYEIIERSGNICVWLFLERPLSEAQIVTLKGVLQAIDGYLDGGFRDGLLIATVPLRAGFTTIEQVLDDFVHSNGHSYWHYGNIYDPRDRKTPLHWW